MLPNIDAANIAYNLLKTAAGGGIAIGPVLLGCGQAGAHPDASATVRRIVNMTALTVADANAAAKRSLRQRSLTSKVASASTAPCRLLKDWAGACYLRRASGAH